MRRAPEETLKRPPLLGLAVGAQEGGSEDGGARVAESAEALLGETLGAEVEGGGGGVCAY